MTNKITTHTDFMLHTVDNPHNVMLDNADAYNISTMEPYAVRVGSTVVTEQDLEDLLTLMEVLKNMPDDHPLAELKHLMRTHKAFKKLKGHTQ